MSTRFYSLEECPERIDAPSIILRVIDGLGFRFYWATEGLEEADYAFTPAEGGNSLGWMVTHIWALTNWIRLNTDGVPENRAESLCAQREQVLALLSELRDVFATLSPEDLAQLRFEGLPFWHMINGPLADALTHVGQIRYVRGLLGKKAPDANVFTGRPPDSSG